MLRVCSVFVLLCLPLVALADVVGPLRVIDGDTIEVAGERVRLHAIDAPEQDQTCQTELGPRFACGAWVTAQVRTRFEGRVARCAPLNRDRYGRLVARCDVAGADLGQVLVSDGLAFAVRRYGMDYDLEEKAAFVADRGLHAVRVQSPGWFRQSHAVGRIPPDPGCAIKGNLSPHGAIYHVPGQYFYERTGIREAKGERWFCSVAAAEAAGWRAAKR